jgi:hypothetical protein
MHDRRLRRQCEARLRELNLPDPFDIRTFCEVLRAQRVHPIVLHPLTGTTGACGVWVSVPAADLIFYEQGTSRLHQQHIILHEVSHLLCDHQPVPVSDGEVPELLFPDLHLKTVKHVLQRSGYSTYEKREAETLASLILERVSTGQAIRTSITASGNDEALHRLESSLQTERREPS